MRMGDIRRLGDYSIRFSRFERSPLGMGLVEKRGFSAALLTMRL
jgi:hypothetical protein